MTSTEFKFVRNEIDLIKFNRTKLAQLLKENKVAEAKRYIDYFFFPYENKIFYFDGYVFNLFNKEDALKLIPNDMKIVQMIPNEQTKKFEKEEYNIKSYLTSTEFMSKKFIPTINFETDDLIFSQNKRIRGFDFKEDYVNMVKPFNFDVIRGKPILETETIKQHLNLIYDHIKNVLCDKNKDTFEYVLNFFACSFAGRKLRKALYLQSKERTGKGIIINDLLKGILGDRLHKTNSVEEILKYTKKFEGCCLLNFDEIPHCDNYKGLQDSLKSLVTEPHFCCRDMYSAGYQQINSFNILITTNNEAIILSQSNDSKYVCLDINEDKIGDFEYFKKLKKAISNVDVCEIFYNQMLERFKKLEDWNEDIMPFTTTRKQKIIEALPNILKFIKTEYIQKQINIDCLTSDFITNYKAKSGDKSSPQRIGRYLKQIGVIPIKNSNNQGYNYRKTFKELEEIFTSKNWIDEEIEFCVTENNSEYGEEDEILQLRKENELLKMKIIEQNKSKIKKIVKEKVIDKNPSKIEEEDEEEEEEKEEEEEEEEEEQKEEAEEEEEEEAIDFDDCEIQLKML